jgi:thiol-disulfide isomerase/thioredoxin
MRNCIVLFSCLLYSVALGAEPARSSASLWENLVAKRVGLKSFHQEFEVSRTVKTSEKTQGSKSTVVVDASGGRWRERSVSGSGERVRVFDGADSFEFESDGEEFVRLKPDAKAGRPEPDPYSVEHLDWAKMTERGKQSCGLQGIPDVCVTMEVPLKPWARNSETRTIKMQSGIRLLIVDTTTGLVLSSRTVENLENGRTAFQSDTAYVLKRLSYNGELEASMFQVPAQAAKEVKELSPWDANRIKRQLAGKPAPDLTVTDMQGKSIRISDLRGKTVLLDFWATWCPPCNADGPALDKLYQKYGGNNLAIIGVSVNEEGSVVQKYLATHPHPYSIVLTTENEMPRAYQIGLFPTYIVIDRQGNLMSAAEGDKGFGELRKMLKKAGLETD